MIRVPDSYTDEDFARLHQILFLKYLGFSLDDIREMTIRNSDHHFMSEFLHLQMGFLEERMEQMELMKQALSDASRAVDNGETVDWSQMLTLVNLNEMEQKLKKQYLNSSNITATYHIFIMSFPRNGQGLVPLGFSAVRDPEREAGLLELGCGDASLWTENMDLLPSDVTVVLSDISDGMVRDAKKSIGTEDRRFQYEVMDAHHINATDHSVDLIIANHVLFYCEDLPKVCQEVVRVLKPGGRFVCSTYGDAHMREISQLVQEFDDRILLSADRLYERFGKENGAELLDKFFSQVQWQQYEDSLNVTDSEALIAYVLSCHGNQNRYIVNRYKDFQAFVEKKTSKGFHITKDAGVFLAMV